MLKKNLKTTVIVSLIVLSLVLPLIDLEEVEAAYTITDVEIIKPSNSVYAYDLESTQFLTRVFWDGQAGAIQFWIKYDSETTYVERDAHPKTLSSGWQSYGTYYDIYWTVDIDAFSTGKHDLYVKVRDVYNDVYWYESAVFHRDSEPVYNYPPTVTIDTPDNFDEFDINAYSEIETKATITDQENKLDWIKVSRDGVVNNSWSSPEPNKQYTWSIPISSGDVGNSIIIRWEAQDGNGQVRCQQITVSVFDTYQAIDLIEPTYDWQSDNSFNVKVNWTTDDDLDDGRNYILQNSSYIGFDIGNENSSYDDVSCDTSVSHEFAINDTSRISSYSVEYGDVYQTFGSMTVEDGFSGSDAFTFDDTVRTWTKWYSFATGTESSGEAQFHFFSQNENGISASVDSDWACYGESDATLIIRTKCQLDDVGELYAFTIRIEFAANKYYGFVFQKDDGGTLYHAYTTTVEDCTFLDKTEISGYGSYYSSYHECKFCFHYDAIQANRYIKLYIDNEYVAEIGNSRLATMDSDIRGAHVGHHKRAYVDFWMDWVKSGDLTETSSSAETVGLTNSCNTTLTSNWGEDIAIVHSSTLSCRFDCNITLAYECNYYEVFDGASGTTRVDTWNIPTASWNQLQEGEFEMDLYMSIDTSAVFWFNFTMYFDETAASLWAVSPRNNSVHDSRFPIPIIWIVDYGLNENHTGNSISTWLNGGIAAYKNQHSYWFGQGEYELTIMAVDSAGNSNFTTIFFTVYDYRDVSFHFFSSIDGFGLDREIARLYVKDYVMDDYERVNPDTRIVGSTFALEVDDYFGNVIYENSSIAYSRHVDIGLPLREVVFWHNTTLYQDEYVPITVYLTRNGTTQTWKMSTPFEAHVVRLLDGNYSLLCLPEKRFSDDGTYEYYAYKEEITVEGTPTGTTRSFSVKVQGKTIGEDEPAVSGWKKFISVFGYIGFIGVTCAVAGLIINFYYKRRQTKITERAVEEQVIVSSRESLYNDSRVRQAERRNDDNRRRRRF